MKQWAMTKKLALGLLLINVILAGINLFGGDDAPELADEGPENVPRLQLTAETAPVASGESPLPQHALSEEPSSAQQSVPPAKPHPEEETRAPSLSGQAAEERGLPAVHAQAGSPGTVGNAPESHEGGNPPGEMLAEGGSESHCYRLGPVRDQDQLERLQQSLREAQLNSVILSEDPGVVLGHWVYLPPERSLALARLKLEELKLKGLQDVAIVLNGEPKYAISLGVYRNKLTARKRLKRIRALGYEPELALRYRRQPETWLLVETTPQTEPTEAGWRVLLDGLGELEYQPHAC